jgi:hypothetical protein
MTSGSEGSQLELLGVSLALAHSTEEFSERMWGINKPI